jgi:hypothetical protein
LYQRQIFLTVKPDDTLNKRKSVKRIEIFSILPTLDSRNIRTKVINWEIVGAVITHEETLYYSRINSKRSPASGTSNLDEPKGKRPGMHCTGSWVGPRVCLDGCRKPLTRWDKLER